MLRYAAAAGASLLVAACRRADTEPQSAQAVFAQGALRIDLLHQLAAGDERFELARVRAEPRWAGRTERLDEAPDWGDYRFSLYDARGGALIFREGFDSSIAPNARGAATQHSVRFPLPLRAVDAVIEKRRPGSTFTEAWRLTIDPADAAIERAAAALTTRVETLLSHGDPASKVDIAIVGDGYPDREYAKFIADAKRASDYLFSVEPFRRRMRDFNVHAVFSPSAASGVTDPYSGVRKDTPLRCTYGSGEAERSLYVGDHYALREAAASAPYDFLLVLANSRRYGGSAHFGGPAVAAIDSAFSKYLVVHEFAHVIGGLADEYYVPAAGGPVYTGNVEPWNPNVTIAPEQAKWRDPASGAAAQPLSWNKAEYDRYFAGYVRRYTALRDRRADETAVENFMRRESVRQAALLAKAGTLRRVGLFEGANGYAKGVFRSEASCIMLSLQSDYFCHACAFAIETMIDRHCV